MSKVNFYKRRVNKLRRHFRIFYPYITFRKVANVFTSEIDFLRGRHNVRSFPYGMKVEPTILCNLSCPGCFRNKKDENVRHSEMDFKLFQKIVDEILDYLLEITLYDQGEPLVCKDIAKFIKYAHQANIATVISSNFSMELTDRQLRDLIESGLDYLIVAVDGVTQDTYERYRKGGNLERLLFNLKKIISLREKMNKRRPIVEWQMIDFEWNKEEQALAKKMSKVYGCDYFRVITNGYTLNANHNYLRRKKCPLLWSSFSVEVNGDFSACYINDDVSLDMGNCQVSSIKDIWFSKAYTRLREEHNNVSKRSFFCQKCQMHD